MNFLRAFGKSVKAPFDPTSTLRQSAKIVKDKNTMFGKGNLERSKQRVKQELGKTLGAYGVLGTGAAGVGVGGKKMYDKATA